MYLLDTNVVSELRKSRQGLADREVTKWASRIAADNQYLSAVTLEELEIGVLRLERRDPLQGSNLRAWMNDLVLPTFAGRILPVDIAVVQRSARLHVPNPCPIRDGFIAATALVHGMTIVTRNVADFESTGATVLNPWQESAGA
jgi:predicted nucleic acid-binding protein